jgi:hypothetical protein
MKNSESFSIKTANDPLGAATLASFFGTSGQKIRQREGVKYKAKIVEDDGSDSEGEKEENKQEVKKQKNWGGF